MECGMKTKMMMLAMLMLVPSAGFAQWAQIQHDDQKEKQWRSMETGPWDFAPDWYYYLFHHDYAYLYEKRVKLIDHGRVTYRYPDFTILDPVTRQEVIFEHFGMVDQDHYFRNSFIDKLRLYLENGYVIGENLLFTFETQEHPFTIDLFARVLEARFGKGKKE